MCGRVEGCKDVAGQERQAKGEVGAGEDGKGLDEDVGDGLVAGEVRVKLVAAMPWLARNKQDAGVE